MSSLVFHLPTSILYLHAGQYPKNELALIRLPIKLGDVRRHLSIALLLHVRLFIQVVQIEELKMDQVLAERHVARPSKKFRSYEIDKIDKLRAMAEFGLRFMAVAKQWNHIDDR
ncbi:hypothetical protein NECAME_15550 [Necator americanus]|uniref:Uncharacterized protein n=1 Tax=Necator americanus TaxID=51031 RepID=W2SJ60_NECAM|nr:hypothetical protein NECAME_15550 [Necator americanus]ETN68906.1 hypothetical protein NECAME_15550 [Necator americanus]